MKKLFLVILSAITILFSCKKNIAPDIPQTNCILDSIAVHENVNSNNLVAATAFKFNYQNNELKEIKAYFGNYLIETQKLFFDANKRLKYKEYYTTGNGRDASYKKEFLFNASGLFSGIRVYVQKSSNSSEFFKAEELSLTYNNINPISATLSYWNQNDSIVPVEANTTNFISNNGNIEGMSGQDILYYQIMPTENLLLKNSQFLLDPVFEAYFFYSVRLPLLPFVINKNTTITYKYLGGSNEFNFRVAYNAFSQPESIANDFGVWDYYYKNCE